MVASALLAVLAAVTGAPSDRPLPAVVLGLDDAAARGCRAQISALLRGRGVLSEPRAVGLGAAALLSEDELGAEEWIKWLDVHGKRSPGPALVVIGELVEGDTLRLDAFRLPGPRRVGLKTLQVSRGCRIHPRVRIALDRWLGGLAHAGGRPGAPPGAVESGVAARDADDVDPSPDEDDLPLQPGLEGEGGEVDDQEPRPARGDATIGWIEGGVRLSSRAFRYDGAATPNLREYRFDLVPVPGVDATIYPAVAFRIGERWLAPLWLSVHYAQSLGLFSERTEGGPRHPTNFSELGVELGYRIAIELADRHVHLSPIAGLERTRFVIAAAADGTREREIPGVDYGSLFFGAQLEVPVRDRIDLFGQLGYLAVLGAGPQLEDPEFFPDSSVQGFAAGAGFAVRIVDALELRVGGWYRRYFLDFEPAQGAERRANGASDEMLAISAMLRWVLR